MTDNKASGDDVIYQSPASEPDDDFWLEQANKMIVDSLPAVRSATSALMTGLGALQGIYLGMLGFAKFVPETMELRLKALFIVPPLCWMVGLLQCLQVMKTENLQFFRHSPEDIRQSLKKLAKRKQRKLELAFYWMLSGLLAAFLLVALRLNI